MYVAEGEDTHKITLRETENMERPSTIIPEDGMVSALTLDVIDLFVKIPAGQMVVEDLSCDSAMGNFGAGIS